MGQLKKLVNMDKLGFGWSTWLNLTSATDISGANRTFNCTNGSADFAYNASPFIVQTAGTTYTAADKNYPFVYASSDSNIPYSQTSITNQVGNCSISFTKTADGWLATITVTGSTDATISSLLFTKKMLYNAFTSYEFLFFAYILDNPITLNAGNNYTANFTMAIKFGE